MRAGLTYALAIGFLAGAAVAQTPAKAPGTVSGVTVMPMPKKTCSSRDKTCIAMVVAELKRDYPEQLKQFCFEEQTKAARNQFVNDQLLDALHGNGPPTPTAAPVSPVVKQVCAPDKPGAKTAIKN